jgi:uncharacterized protein YqfA (UPF0365 family)
MSDLMFLLLIAGGLAFAFFTLLYFVPVNLWITAVFSGVRIGIMDLVLMRIRKVPPAIVVNAMITSSKAGLHVTANEIETHYLAGGHVNNVIRALISAEKANIPLDFKAATAIDLAGRDVFEAVQMSVNPKVIDTPPVTAVAKDGIQLIARARVTVRASIKQLVGGAGEETVLARVGEGVVSSIGSALNHKEVLENPDKISKVVLNKGLDAGFEILSIDIADVDVGKNIGAGLQTDQAEADKKIAQARAEEKRAMAVALEQEFKAKTQEARAKVIESEAQIPLAMADAFRQGRLGIMDYYRMQNIKADTDMRESIAKPGSTSTPG